MRREGRTTQTQTSTGVPSCVTEPGRRPEFRASRTDATAGLQRAERDATSCRHGQGLHLSGGVIWPEDVFVCPNA